MEMTEYLVSHQIMLSKWKVCQKAYNINQTVRNISADFLLLSLRFDDAVARPPRRSSKTSVSDDAMNYQASAGSVPGVARHAKRENSSAQRARARLNQLLQVSGALEFSSC